MQVINKEQIKEFIKESVEWLVDEQMGCCRYKLDDHLAIFVGWSAGYGDEERYDVIQAKDNPDYAINAGIKVWTSDDMWTDYDWLNFPYYKDGDVLDMDCAISPQEDWERVTDYLLIHIICVRARYESAFIILFHTDCATYSRKDILHKLYGEKGSTKFNLFTVFVYTVVIVVNTTFATLTYAGVVFLAYTIVSNVWMLVYILDNARSHSVSCAFVS